MKKVYRALTNEVCEKKFIGDNTDCPDGWSETPSDALAVAPAPAPYTPEPPVVSEPESDDEAAEEEAVEDLLTE